MFQVVKRDGKFFNAIQIKIKKKNRKKSSEDTIEMRNEEGEG